MQEDLLIKLSQQQDCQQQSILVKYSEQDRSAVRTEKWIVPTRNEYDIPRSCEWPKFVRDLVGRFMIGSVSDAFVSEDECLLCLDIELSPLLLSIAWTRWAVEKECARRP